MYDRKSNTKQASAQKIVTKDSGLPTPIDTENNVLPTSTKKVSNASTGNNVFKKPNTKHKPPLPLPQSKGEVLAGPDIVKKEPADIVRLVRLSILL